MRLESWRTPTGLKGFMRSRAGLLDLQDVAPRPGCRRPATIQELLESGAFQEVLEWHRRSGEEPAGHDSWSPSGQDRPAPLLSRPPKIIGIGLNYAAHARDLSESAPQGLPGSFMKPATTIVGHGDPILLPANGGKITGEAELGLVIGKQCRNVPETRWREVVAGFTPVLDMTAEDILRRNPRYLTLSKSFDTFLVLGFELVSVEEIEELPALEVKTVLDGEVVARGRVEQMTFGPARLVALLSEIMTLQPGDLILTGTPGAAALEEGQLLEARIEGFQALRSPVQRI